MLLQVSESEKLPKQMCEACTNMLKKLYYFKQMALKSNVILKQHLMSQVTHPINI